MKNLRIAVLLSSLLVIAGCGTTKEEYLAYVEAEKARYLAEVARYQALSNIGTKGDPTASTVATLMLGLGGAAGGAGAASGPTPPTSSSETALRWASILIPGLTSLGNTAIGAGVSKRQSDNSRMVGISTNETMLGMAREIQAPGPIYNNSFNTLAP